MASNQFLFHAVTTGDVSHAARLLRSGADVNTANANGSTTVHVAASQGHVQMLETLLVYSPNLAAKELDSVGGATALHLAVKANPDVVRALLRAKSDPRIPDSQGFTPLHIAARFGQVDSVKELLAANADPIVEDKQGKTAYYWAKEFGFPQVMELLPVFNYDPLVQFDTVKVSNPVPVPPSGGGKKKGKKGAKKGKKGKKK